VWTAGTGQQNKLPALLMCSNVAVLCPVSSCAYSAFTRSASNCSTRRRHPSQLRAQQPSHSSSCSPSLLLLQQQQHPQLLLLLLLLAQQAPLAGAQQLQRQQSLL
jgi:hypothetical protein